MYSFDEVKNADPELAKAMEQETGRQNDHIELIASENCNGCYGKHTDKQIRRRLSGKTLLRRMPVCGHRRRFGKRPRKKTVWLYLRKCSATFRCPGKHGCILCFG